MEKQAEKMINRAIKTGTNDIHVLPEKNSYVIYFRVPSGLKRMMELSFESGERLISYYKFLANMDVGERRKPQSGSCNFSLALQQMELRISTISNYLYQESMVIRLLYDQAEWDNRDLNVFFPKDFVSLSRMLRYKSGLILFSGPVGAGKTSTIYHLLRKKYAESPIQVITMEDPVEIKEPKFLQSEVNEQAGISYETLIKQSLRHHPDILVIGEIRDVETAKMVIRSALTGHLVLATIHAKECVGVIERMLELGVTSEQLKQSLVGVVSQRLINKYCPLCDGSCSIYCSYFSTHQKKAILFELLNGIHLKNVLNRKGGDEQRMGLNQKLRKAYAYGYLTQKEFLENQVF